MKPIENNYTLPTLLFLILFSVTPIYSQDVQFLDKAIEAHGGESAWQSYHALSFDMVQEDGIQYHVIDLSSRKTRQGNDDYTIGYDGSNVWVAPDSSAFSGNAKFYNGLIFYFFAMPFVFTDPGVNTEFLGEQEIGGESYNVVKISYNDGVGASSNDTYLAHFDPSTNRLKVLLYTVTFFSGTPSTSFNAMVFNEWQEVQGLLVPVRMTSHPWDKDKGALGAARGTMEFENIKFDTSAPSSSTFTKPDEATYVH